MVERLLKETFKEASVLPLWLHVGSASAHEPRATEKVCMWSWCELKSLGNTIRDVLARDQKLELDGWGPLIKQIGFTAEF
ncbi:MAG: hypothetical protein H7228_10810 [Polaromonas sp.]|nr:hypothetical protein [Polaromonas sp.]